MVFKFSFPIIFSQSVYRNSFSIGLASSEHNKYMLLVPVTNFYLMYMVSSNKSKFIISDR